MTSYLTELDLCVLVTFEERGHFVMPIIKSMHLINLHFWTYLLKGTCMWQQIIYNGG